MHCHCVSRADADLDSGTSQLKSQPGLWRRMEDAPYVDGAASRGGNGRADGGRNMAAAQLHWRSDSPSATSIHGQAHDLEV
jgi:hypothetical protein